MQKIENVCFYFWGKSNSYRLARLLSMDWVYGHGTSKLKIFLSHMSKSRYWNFELYFWVCINNADHQQWASVSGGLKKAQRLEEHYFWTTFVKLHNMKFQKIAVVSYYDTTATGFQQTCKILDNNCWNYSYLKVTCLKIQYRGYRVINIADGLHSAWHTQIPMW